MVQRVSGLNSLKLNILLLQILQKYKCIAGRANGSERRWCLNFVSFVVSLPLRTWRKTPLDESRNWLQRETLQSRIIPEVLLGAGSAAPGHIPHSILSSDLKHWPWQPQWPPPSLPAWGLRHWLLLATSFWRRIRGMWSAWIRGIWSVPIYKESQKSDLPNCCAVDFLFRALLIDQQIRSMWCR